MLMEMNSKRIQGGANVAPLSVQYACCVSDKCHRLQYNYSSNLTENNHNLNMHVFVIKIPVVVDTQ